MRRLFLLFFFLFGISQARSETVLVLPFFNRTDSSNLDWIGESVSESIREALASGGALVHEREARVEAFRRLSIRPGATLTSASVIKLGELLDARQVVYGEFEVKPAPDDSESMGSLKIIARTVDLRDLKKGPEMEETGALEDLAALERRLAWEALRLIAPRAAVSEEEFRRNRPTVRVDALENYVRGLLAPSPEQKHRFFTQAARLDPEYSQPRFQLGRMFVEKKDYGVAAGWLEGVKPADSHYMESRFLLGLCRYYNGDFAGAVPVFEEVAKAVPLNEVLNNLGAAQSRLNQPAALENFSKARDGDTTDPDYHFNTGYALWKRGDFAGAVAAFRAVLERSPDDPQATTMLGRALQENGPRPGDPNSDGLERLKLDYEETAYRQLKAELEGRR
jgi:tetratricopeptide (TPR) repeat protein